MSAEERDAAVDPEPYPTTWWTCPQGAILAPVERKR